MRFNFLLLFYLLQVHFGYAQAIIPVFPPKDYTCFRSLSALQIDGLMDEKSWQLAPWTDDFVDIEGDKKPLPRFRTRAKMLWDDQYLYFAAEIEEPHIWATLKQRDTVIFYDNDFEIFIDPDGDTHRYYEFEMNAFNTLWDLLLITPYRDHGNAVLNSWDIRGIKTAVNIEGTLNQPVDTDQKWTVEIAMPWEVLKEQALGRKKPEAGDCWRINFSRVEWQVDIVEGQYQKRKDPETGKRLREDNWVWSPQGVINMHRPETWGFVVFSESAAGEEEAGFQLPEHEWIKWELRKLYYAQRAYFREHQGYQEVLSQLSPVTPEGATLHAGTAFYVISLPDTVNNSRWYINEQGHTWSEEK